MNSGFTSQHVLYLLTPFIQYMIQSVTSITWTRSELMAWCLSYNKKWTDFCEWHYQHPMSKASRFVRWTKDRRVLQPAISKPEADNKHQQLASHSPQVQQQLPSFIQLRHQKFNFCCSFLTRYHTKTDNSKTVHAHQHRQTCFKPTSAVGCQVGHLLKGIEEGCYCDNGRPGRHNRGGFG